MSFRSYRTTYLAPSDIRFTQDSIGKYFQDGNLVNDLISDIECGRVEIDDIPLIKVAKKNNKYYSSDNRRLYVFRALQKRGSLEKIKVRLVREIYDNKMTTSNDGEQITVRYGTTFPHTFNTWTGVKWNHFHLECATNSPSIAEHVNVIHEECTRKQHKNSNPENPGPKKGYVFCLVIGLLFIMVLAWWNKAK